MYATALNTDGEEISYRPLRIGYTRTAAGRRGGKKSCLDNILENVNTPSGLNKRSAEPELDIEGRVSYIAMEYIKFFTENIRNRKIAKLSDQQDVLGRLQSLNEKLSRGDELAGRISKVIAARLMMMISE